MGVKAMTELELIQEIQKKGVHSAAFVDTVKVPFDPDLRKYCTPQACGSYGKNWGCPPAVGDIYDLIQRAKQYKRTLVYETVAQLEDSFDYEGIRAGGLRHKQITNEITPLIRSFTGKDLIQLSAGGCTVCERCSKMDEQPCRFPERALHSVFAYGIYVSKLAKICGLEYNNGENTVTMFGVVFFQKSE